MKTGRTVASTIVRNVGATTRGGEAGLAYRLTDTWKVDATLAYVRGNNDTDGTPLAQLPPLEGRLGLNYDDKVWSVGALLRLVCRNRTGSTPRRAALSARTSAGHLASACSR